MDNLQPRSYQLEMFEMSMEENIVAVMPTGSGKTYMYGLIDIPPSNIKDNNDS
ncbi:unnamed protein product [Penicillium crustosum]